MLGHFRAFFGAIFTPIAKLLVRLGISPDVVTVVGTIGASGMALWFFPQGRLLTGTLAVTAFIFSDILDGIMARLIHRTSDFGAFLDSTLDRFGDAAIFGALVLYFAGDQVVGTTHPDLYRNLALYCLVMGSVTSYARTKAESLNYAADIGIAERSDRLVLILFATGLSDWWNMPYLLFGALWILTVASSITVLQRILVVRTQAHAKADAALAASAD
jgi:CDP-diacylglycerol---glycerol-3-phosphate 3-phosphatidyltransferase